jgi:hypothetical protein
MGGGGRHPVKSVGTALDCVPHLSSIVGTALPLVPHLSCMTGKLTAL